MVVPARLRGRTAWQSADRTKVAFSSGMMAAGAPTSTWVYVDGKRKRKYIYAETRAEVHTAMLKIQRDVQQGMAPTVSDRLTVKQFLQQWLEDSVKPGVRPRTYESYCQIATGHIMPVLGRTPLTKLTPQQVQSLLNQKGTENLSPRTVEYIRAVLRIALNRALRWGMVSRNVAALATSPEADTARSPSAHCGRTEDAYHEDQRGSGRSTFPDGRRVRTAKGRTAGPSVA